MIGRVALVYRRTATILLTTCLVLLALDLGARAVLAIVTPSPALKYHPYTLWRAAPVASPTLNVTGEGLRVTPGSECRPSSRRVWIFGGSTVWGGDVPDDGTLPAALQRLMPEACVTNFGQIAYTSTQGVIQLETELRDGRRPSLVIFYDGVNDALAALATRRPGLHHGLEDITTRLEHPISLRNLLQSSHLVQLVKYGVHRGGSRIPSQPDAIADATASGYRVNVRIVQTLARAFDFLPAFFWQPSLLTGRKPLTPEERKIPIDPELKSLFERIHARIHLLSRDVDGLHDLTAALDQFPAHAYTDWHHLTPAANDRIARAIVHLIPR
jgi:lysophospholipase L1-like esterase